MRIVYVAANFHRSWATESHIAHELELLGHTVTRVNEAAVTDAVGYENLFGVARFADVLFYSKARGLDMEPATSLWRKLEKVGCRTASIHLDLYDGLARASEVGNDPMWTTGRVFTADGDPAFQVRCAALGIEHRWMPPAVVSDEAVPGTYRPDLAHDVVFVGSTGSYHREWPWRMELLAFLRRRYGGRFRSYDHGSGMRDAQLNDLYASASVIVGDSLALPGREKYFSDRYFETVGRGGFLVGPRVPGIEEFLTDYLHCRYYDVGDTDTLGKIIDLYVDAPDKARDIAERGQRHVRSFHTYRHRLAAVLEELP